MELVRGRDTYPVAMQLYWASTHDTEDLITDPTTFHTVYERFKSPDRASLNTMESKINKALGVEGGWGPDA